MGPADVFVQTRAGKTAVLHAAVAQTPREIAQGLAGRTPPLLPDEAMLFDLGMRRRTEARFTTIGMRFPIDFVFLAVGDRLTEDEAPAHPLWASMWVSRIEYALSQVVPGILQVAVLPPEHRTQTPVRWVLEAPAGWLARWAVRVGDLAVLQFGR